MGSPFHPFDKYPHGGTKLTGIRFPSMNARHGEGLQLQRRTGQSSCAYCGISLIDTYERRLTLSIDHVVPSAVGKKRGIPPEWIEDLANCVLCCRACNELDNQPKVDCQPPASEQAFVALRDEFFVARSERIQRRHDHERAFYNSKPSQHGT